MAEIRLSKLTKQFSIGLARLVDFLNEKGADVEMNPNAKISDEYLPAIEAKFGEDQKLKADSEKVTIKLKEIIEMGSKKKATVEEEIPEQEVVIKSTSLNVEAPKAQPKEEAEPVVEQPVKQEKKKGFFDRRARVPAPDQILAGEKAAKEQNRKEEKKEVSKTLYLRYNTQDGTVHQQILSISLTKNVYYFS